VKRLRKWVQQILRSFSSEKSLKRCGRKKRKKLTQAKYIALPASVPSGLNNYSKHTWSDGWAVWTNMPKGLS